MIKEAIERYFNNVVRDMAAENDKVPVSKFRMEVTQIEGTLYGPDWFQYMIYGRGPGKQPPPDRIRAWVERNESLFGSDISVDSLTFLIGRKIGREGTDIFQGKKKGVDLLGAMEKNMPELLEGISEELTEKINTGFKKAI